MHKDSGVSLSQLYVDGGMSNNNIVLQSQADLLGVPVIRPRYIETTAVGAAICAAIGRGIYQSIDQIPPVSMEEETIYESKMSQEQRELELKRWDLAIHKSYHSNQFSS
ncbi:Glycerol kinase [compost metagenome]